MAGRPLTERSDGVSCVQHGESLVVYGGAVCDRVWVLDLVSWTWAAHYCGGETPPPRRHHAAAVVGSVMCVHGGELLREEDSAEADSRLVWLLDLSTRRWAAMPPAGPCPGPRSHHSCTAHGGSLLLYGGRQPGCATAAAVREQQRGGFFDLWVLDLAAAQWDRVCRYDPLRPMLWGHSAVMFRHWMLVFGGVDVAAGDTGGCGADGAPSAALSDTVHIWNTERSEWQRSAATPPQAPLPRAMHSAVVRGAEMLVLGGVTLDPHAERLLPINDAWRWDIVRGQWAQLAFPLSRWPSARLLVGVRRGALVVANSLQRCFVLDEQPQGPGGGWVEVHCDCGAVSLPSPGPPPVPPPTPAPCLQCGGRGQSPQHPGGRRMAAARRERPRALSPARQQPPRQQPPRPPPLPPVPPWLAPDSPPSAPTAPPSRSSSGSTGSWAQEPQRMPPPPVPWEPPAPGARRASPPRPLRPAALPDARRRELREEQRERLRRELQETERAQRAEAGLLLSRQLADLAAQVSELAGLQRAQLAAMQLAAAPAAARIPAHLSGGGGGGGGGGRGDGAGGDAAALAREVGRLTDCVGRLIAAPPPAPPEPAHDSRELPPPYGAATPPRARPAPAAAPPPRAAASPPPSQPGGRCMSSPRRRPPPGPLAARRAARAPAAEAPPQGPHSDPEEVSLRAERRARHFAYLRQQLQEIEGGVAAQDHHHHHGHHHLVAAQDAPAALPPAAAFSSASPYTIS
eukprot:TRINITY_DN14231_c0_g2_i1.p1 TRINITY_DN14231_c0_g2~~TRINITY_DN14231_c0_g2_i1.p1  ORF type:complete len:772 (+),score=195.57 TRINITY_DN14231_c0_g2_i1:95-2317(+)